MHFSLDENDRYTQISSGAQKPSKRKRIKAMINVKRMSFIDTSIAYRLEFIVGPNSLISSSKYSGDTVGFSLPIR